MKKEENILITFSPILLLIILLCFNIFFFENTMNGPNQIALLIASLFASCIAFFKKTTLKKIKKGIYDSIKSSINAITILLIIGGLTSTWILSGIVPAMIYYGTELISPRFFLLTTCIICAIVSLSTGSSWTTAATIGIALVGIGELLSINTGMVAGAIISGSYFGDKMSPLSETTNLAPSVSGSDLINHIKYMTYTTIPTITITLIIFFCIGIASPAETIVLDKVNGFLTSINTHFYIGVELFLLPLIIVILIYARVPAVTTLSIGLVTGVLFACVFQKELIDSINEATNNNTIETITHTIFSGTNIITENNDLNELLSKNGVLGMSWIILLVLSAMTFGGVMHAGGFLKRITSLLISKTSSNVTIIQSTAGSCIFFNISTCDQYLAIVIPGRMFKEVYEEHNLDPTNLSRTIEDSGTVTSVLVPWNSCAAYHAEMLAIQPITYLPFCFFNILSPIMTLLFAYFSIYIKKLDRNEEK